MLLNPQILLLCGIYFSVQLSIYANTFWLPSIVKQIPGTTDFSVGFLSAIPWVCAVVAMYFAAKWQDKAKSKRPLLVVALLVAAVGTLAAAIATPVPAIAIINSLGNLGGFVAPFPGLFALAAASTLAAGLVYFLKERRSPLAPDQEAPAASEAQQAAAVH
jgi:MFS family permease